MRSGLLLTALAALTSACIGPAQEAVFGGAAPKVNPSRPFVALSPTRVFVERWPMRSLPVPTRREEVEEELHGVEVRDPYRWLEAGEDPDVSSWIDAENALLERTLSRVPGRSRLEARLSELLTIGSISLPTLRKSARGTLLLFYSRREDKQDQPVLYVREGRGGADRVLVDPNTLSKDGTTALDWYEPSEDGSLLAYGLSQSGSEDSVLHLRDVETGRDLPDVIPGTRHASIAWLPDGKHFLYTRYPEPGSVPDGDERYQRRVYEHALGRDPKADPLVFGAGLEPTDFANVQASPDGRWVVASVSRGWDETELHLADRTKTPLTFQPITPKGKNRYFAIPRKDALYVLTNEGAPRYRVFRVNPEAPERSGWLPLLSEHPTDVVGTLEVTRDELLVVYQSAGISRLERFDHAGKSRGPIPLPTLGSCDGFSALTDGTEAFYNFESFAVPPVIRHIELTDGRTEEWQSVRADVPTGDYAVASFEATSRDGTRVPYRVVHRKGIDLASRKNPTLLYGYGGFNTSMEPRFSRSNYVWLERGGVYVQSILRGGGEFGESWHRAGQLEKKQNTFDDFIAVAEDLISRNITSREQLAIHGRSNGGLLVAAALTQRPDLFRAAVAGVPLTDMVRYPKFQIAKLWIPEYGSPDVPEEFRILYGYSPYHHVREGVEYPAVLVTTAESDTRVDPLHARKFVAELQYANRSERPILLRTERKAGHGAGMPVSKLVHELTDLYSFLFSELGVEIAP